MPAAYARTATQALTNITGRYVELLADRGLEGACNKQPALLGGVNTRDGILTIQAVAEAHGLPYTPTFSTETLGSLGGLTFTQRKAERTPCPEYEMTHIGFSHLQLMKKYI